jgi:hypothetical protein
MRPEKSCRERHWQKGIFMSEAKKKAKFNIALVGTIVAFDPETGDALHIHEEHVETTDDKPTLYTGITADDCEKIRQEAIRRYPRRRIDVISARPEDMLSARPDGVIGARPEVGGLIVKRRYHVDPMTRKLRMETEPDFGFPEQLAQMGFGTLLRSR